MLKYQVNTKTARTDLERLNASSVSSTSVPFDGTNNMLLTCYLNDRDVVHENDTIVAVYEIETNTQNDGRKSTIVEEYSVISVNDAELTFNLVYDKYFVCEAEFARKETTVRYDKKGEISDVSYLVIYFSSYHHLIGDSVYNKECTVYLSDSISTSTEQMIQLNGEIVDNYTVRFDLSIQNNMDAYNRIFVTDIDKIQNYSALTYFKVIHDNFMFETNDDGELLHTTLYVQKNVATIKIPLTNTFSTELYSSMNVDAFVKKQIEDSLNKSAENEKDIYHPVIKESGKITQLKRLKFNFHFRQRKEENWIVDQDKFWNGVIVNQTTGEFEFANSFFSYTDESSQSDLLGLLSFTNADVKYRRNVLKKSFIRLLFYDSNDPIKQRLLSYSTIFIDTGTLLNRYMRCVENDNLGFGYLRYNNDTGAAEKGLHGIQVDRELDIDHSYGDVDMLENCRLSSQIVVSDKYMSSTSAEGFYLYLWKDNADIVDVPNDIYMKVEFNHAKYGRVIPFMLPYTESDGQITGVKTFREIVEDVFDKTKLINNGYTVGEFQKYSYIHFKYENTESNGYVYYPDENYGLLVDNNTLILNLYEANVR